MFLLQDRRRGRNTLTNEDATYGWRKSFWYVAKRQNGVQQQAQILPDPLYPKLITLGFTEPKGAKQMSEHKHTPRPWRQGGVKENFLIGKCREIVADDGRIGLVYGITDEDCKADAKLIAAAPELLAACELIKEWMLGGQPGPHSDSVVLDVVEWAIKKAKGE